MKPQTHDYGQCWDTCVYVYHMCNFIKEVRADLQWLFWNEGGSECVCVCVWGGMGWRCVCGGGGGGGERVKNKSTSITIC